MLNKPLSIIFALVALLFTLVLLYLFYKSFIIFQGGKIYYYLPYISICIFIVLFSIITLYQNLKFKLIVIYFSLILLTPLILYEIVVEYDFIKLNNFSDKVEFKDKRTKKQIYFDLKKNNKSIVLAIHPSSQFDNKEILPLAGISNSTTIHCNENGYYNIYISDRYGFNNKDENWNKKIKNLLIGDSFVHGSCVNYDDTFTNHFNNLNGSSLNLAYKGNGPLLALASLKEFIRLIDTNTILWFYYTNDLEDLSNELDNNILLQYLEDSNFTQNLSEKQKLIDNLLSKQLIVSNKIKRIFKLTNTRSIIQRVVLKLINKNNEKPSENIDFTKYLPIYKKILTEAVNLSEDNNANFYFVYLPPYYKFASVNDKKIIDDRTNNYYRNYYKNEIKTDIKRIIHELNIEFIDVDDDFFSIKKDKLQYYPFRKEGHFNEKGYKDISVFINSKL